MVGLILMIVGGIGLLLSLLFWSSFSPFATARRQTVIDDHHHDHLIP